ncbi:endonuclease/exonuclease/phosphatase family protein [Streptomyces sp. NPDC058045]|uniref:endonuclease/exonuclease/phosphatase family protein n=1 Tax=Streptomyces sp. NPDC058045 TaxID=3346311 RepID=UPI0036DFAE62
MLVVSATAAAAPSPPAGKPAAAAADNSLKVLSFNMAGGWTCTVNRPNEPGEDDSKLCDERDPGGEDGAPYDAERTESPKALRDSILTNKPDIVLLQEACRDWTTDVAAAVGYTYEFQAATEGTGAEHECKIREGGEESRDHDFGVAVLTAPGLGAPEFTEYNLGNQGDDEYRWMLCADFAARNLTACSGHTKELSQSQTDKAADVLAREYPGRTKILGADFNASDPYGSHEKQMNSIYHPAYTDGDGAAVPNTSGAYQEVFSPCGESIAEESASGVRCKSYGEGDHSRPSKHVVWLNKQKIDYLFVSEWVTVTSRDVTDAKFSDHRMLWATLDVPSHGAGIPVSTTGNLLGYASPYSGEVTGLLNGGKPRVYCRQWGRQPEGTPTNHWWLLTDLDEGTPWQLQWVSATGLANWGDDEARDDTGKNLPLCAGKIT